MNANVRSAGRRTLTRRIGDAVRSCLMKQPAVWRRGERGSNPGERGARARVFVFFESGEDIGRTERRDPPLRGARLVGRGYRRYRPLARGFGAPSSFYLRGERRGYGERILLRDRRRKSRSDEPDEFARRFFAKDATEL